MSRWADLFSSLLSGTHETHVTEDVFVGPEAHVPHPLPPSLTHGVPGEPKSPSAPSVASVPCVTGIKDREKETTTPEARPIPSVASVPCVTGTAAPQGGESPAIPCPERADSPGVDPEAFAARAAELLAAAERNPVLRVADREKAADYFRVRAIAKLTPQEPGATIHRLRPPSWADPSDIPRPGDRCSCCRGNRWWTESKDPLGWRCSTCHAPPQPFVRTVRT